MTNDKGILIKNVYYMLTYAFQVLKQTNYEEITSEEFENIEDLFAVILAKGIARQLKQGLHREYISCRENLPGMRGKIDIPGTMAVQIQHRKLLVCEYDELSEDNIFNQILKSTVLYLMKNNRVKAEHKADLKKDLLFFSNVSSIRLSEIQWNLLQYQRNNRNYEMLMNVCYFVVSDILQTTEKGSYRMASFLDENMPRLFEKFVLEYYRQKHPDLSEISASQIKWNLSDEDHSKMIRFLPVMQTDVLLRMHDKTLIIDTKYYRKALQNYYNTETLHSNNLYQIFTYVKNADSKNTGKVSGMLLYAKTEESIAPDCEFCIDGSDIIVKTLDLNQDFQAIASQLDSFVDTYLLNTE